MRSGRLCNLCFLCLLLLRATCLWGSPAAYKARRWEPGPAESYPARLASEGVTIAVHPLDTDELAGAVFDKEDMVTGGIMPLALIVFNDNDYAVVLESDSIELVRGDERLHTLSPLQAVQRLFRKSGRSVWIPNPLPRRSSGGSAVDREALEDFEHKFLGRRIVPPKTRSAGFLYLAIPEKAVRAYLESARVYIPDLYRHDTRARLIYFEVDLAPAVTPVAVP